MQELEQQKHDRLLVLHDACEKGNIPDVRKWIGEQKKYKHLGINIHTESEKGCTAIDIACNYNHRDLIKFLIENGSDVNRQIRNIDGNNSSFLLRYAAEEGYIEIVKLLIKKGADINAKIFPGDETPLYIACKKGYVDIAELLIKNGADINVKIHASETPLHIACENGHVDIVELLIGNGADINAKTFSYKKTPLHIACENGHVDIVKLLIKHNANVKISDCADCYPLYYAVELKNKEIVQFFLENKIDITTVEKNSETKDVFLPYYATEHFRNAAEFLKSYTKNLGASDENTKKNAAQLLYLIYSIKNINLTDKIEILKNLIENGVDINILDDDQPPPSTPLDISLFYLCYSLYPSCVIDLKPDEIVKGISFLIEKGAKRRNSKTEFLQIMQASYPKKNKAEWEITEKNFEEVLKFLKMLEKIFGSKQKNIHEILNELDNELDNELEQTKKPDEKKKQINFFTEENPDSKEVFIHNFFSREINKALDTKKKELLLNKSNDTKNKIFFLPEEEIKNQSGNQINQTIVTAVPKINNIIQQNIQEEKKTTTSNSTTLMTTKVITKGKKLKDKKIPASLELKDFTWDESKNPVFLKNPKDTPPKNIELNENIELLKKKSPALDDNRTDDKETENKCTNFNLN